MKLFSVMLSVCTFALLQGAAVHGESLTHWQSIIDPLLHAGIVKIGTFDVEGFRTDASQTVVSHISEAPPSVLSGSRQSAYYRCPQNQVYISDDLPTEAISSLAQLELHEILGARCFDDRSYALSTALVTLAAMNDGSQRQALVQTYTRTVFARPLKLAGATGVSGGGDLVSLYVKNQVLQEIMGDSQNRLAATADFLAKYAMIDFEPLQSSSPRVVHIKYTFYKGGRERFGVYIPMERWRAGNSSRRALIHETALKIMQLFPSYDGQAANTFRPSDCGANGPTVTFPATQDSAVRQIQDSRGGLIKGCRKFMNGFTDIQILAPALDTADTPKDSGNFYFTCTLTYGRGKQVGEVKITAGQDTIHSSSTATPSGGYLEGNVSVSATGNIHWIAILYSSNGKRTLTPMTAPANPLSASSVETIIEGYPASYSCARER